MFFFFKKSKIVVDCFTDLKSVHDLFYIRNSMEFFPPEFSKIDSYYNVKRPDLKISQKVSTIKRCVGIIDYYKTGFMIPMWTDFMCQPRTAKLKQSSIGYISSPFVFSSHPDEQFRPTGMFNDYFHLKFESPWQFREKSGIKFTWTQPTLNLHNHSKNFIVVPGVISFNIHSGTHVNIFIDSNSEDFLINAGTPMVHLSAQTEKEIVIKNHLVSPSELSKIGMPKDFSWILPNRYNRYKNLIENKNSKKCPFGFGK